MSLSTAILLAFTLLDHGKTPRVYAQPDGTAVVTVAGAPGCFAEAMYGDPSRPVVFCRLPAKK